MRHALLCLLLAGVLGGCSDDSSGPGPDGPLVDQTVGADKGATPDLGPADSGPTSDVAAAVSCTSSGGECSGMTGLSCECCGSIGPQAICLCSKQCAGDNDCQGAGLPLCNKAPGQDSGICTPTGFNCCWLCQ